MDQGRGKEHSGSGSGAAGSPQRPGSMTIAMRAVDLGAAAPRVLRIGLIKGDKIVEERIIRRHESVWVGTSEDCHFLVSAQGLPEKFTLFDFVDGAYYLSFSDSMQGRVGVSGDVREFSQLRSAPGAIKDGELVRVQLSEASKGKVTIGNTTLLFQFVAPPPPQPRPQLPAAARGGFVKEVDWTFTAFVVFSYMMFFGGIVFLESYDYPIESDLVEIPESAARLIFEEPLPPEPDTPDDSSKAEQEAPKVQQPERGPSKEEKAEKAEAPKVTAEERAQIADAAAAKAEAMILGALGSGGALADVLAGGAVTGGAEDVLAQAAGVGVAQSGASGLRTRAGGGSGVGGLGDLRAAQGGGKAQGEGAAVTERAIRGRIDVGAGGDTGGTGEFDAAVVVRTIRARLRAIQMCYENELRRDPSLAGKVTVSFTIQTTGTVTGVKASENTSGSAGLGDCIVQTVERFRFNPGPSGGSVSFAYPFVFAPQK